MEGWGSFYVPIYTQVTQLLSHFWRNDGLKDGKKKLQLLFPPTPTPPFSSSPFSLSVCSSMLLLSAPFQLPNLLFLQQAYCLLFLPAFGASPSSLCFYFGSLPLLLILFLLLLLLFGTATFIPFHNAWCLLVSVDFANM